MNRLQAIVRLDGLIQGRWNSINQLATARMTKLDRRAAINQYKLDIEALQLASDALKNPGYQGKGVALETGIDDPA